MLPIEKFRSEIIDSVTLNQVTIIVGETGSGKTTAVPQYLYEAGFGKDGMIGVTEPRRIAAISVARYVALQLGVADQTVAHKIRFSDETSEDTSIKFMTDGILIRELHDDPILSKYSVIMIDEAHERSANIDFLLGMLKQVLTVRPELRLVVASATIDAKKFSAYFDHAPVLKVDGRLHDVKIVWSDTTVWPRDLVRTVVSKVDEILTTTMDGDILVFLTGLDDINAITEEMEYVKSSHDVVILPAHGSLSPEDQGKVFDHYPGRRKVVLATNIAETSITIDGVVYVVDSGLIKQVHFNPQIGIQSLDVVEHSQAGCSQRTGRAGRTKPGVCYRLFTKENFENRPTFTLPEIKRMSLARLVLTMETLEIPDVENFNFIDPPDANAFHEAYETLEALGAVKKSVSGLTPMGVEMAVMPLEPHIGRMVIEAKHHGCVAEVATIAAFMSSGRSAFARPKDKTWEADKAQECFKNLHSDMLTFLNVWKGYEDANFDKEWCFDHFLMSKTLGEIRSIRSQLLEQLSRSGVEITSSDDDDAVLRSVAAGLAYNLLHLVGMHQYMGVERKISGTFIHPGSSVFRSQPQWLVSAEIVHTSKQFARMCSIVKPEWLREIAPSSFTLGERTLSSYYGGDTAIATCPLIYRQKSGMADSVTLSTVTVSITVDEARDLQEARIQKAKQDGLTLLAIRRIQGRYGNELVGRLGREQYSLTHAPFELKSGDLCYCKAERLSATLGYAKPIFSVFEFPPIKPTHVSDDVTLTDVLKGMSAQPDASAFGNMLVEAARRKAGAQ